VRTKISIVICLIFLITGCDLFKSDKLQIEMIAFNKLTKEEQNKIPVTPKDSVVKEITVNEELGKKIERADNSSLFLNKRARLWSNIS
jgi:hypothetical protein